MRNFWNFYSAGQLMFGCGSIGQLGNCALQRNFQKVLIVTDSALVNAGIVSQVSQPLLDAGISVELFADGEPEPSLEIAAAARECAAAFQPDAILGLGGGSNMDLSKITATLLTHGGEPANYFGYNNIPGPVLPLISVPTTAGTGSEVTHAAVLTDQANAIKVSTLSQYLRPSLAIVDPALTLTCPSKATADSGIDALTHAIEAYTAIDYADLKVPAEEPTPYDGKHPLGDVFAEKAIRLIGTHLPQAVKEPENLVAREGMALAATLAGLAFSNCAVAVVHALEYPLGGAVHCSHGAGNGLLLPYVMRFNRPKRGQEFANIAEWLGKDCGGLSIDESAELGIQAVEELRREIGIPERLRELGGTREQLPGFAEKAFGIKRLMNLNPVEPTQEDLLAILESAW